MRAHYLLLQSHNLLGVLQLVPPKRVVRHCKHRPDLEAQFLHAYASNQRAGECVQRKGGRAMS